MRPAVRALRPLFSEPASHAIFATEFGAFRTEHCILDLAKANKAFENLVETSGRIVFRLFQSFVGVFLVAAAMSVVASLHYIQAVTHTYNFIIVIDIGRSSSPYTLLLLRHYEVWLKTTRISRL